MYASDRDYMGLALEEAAHALREGNLPVGAVVVYRGSVVGTGRRSGTRKRELRHAELKAIKQVLHRELEGREMTLYVTLEPCIMCFGALLHLRIGTIVYGLEDPYGGAAHTQVEALPPRHRHEFPCIRSGVMREESRLLLKEFFTITHDKCWKDVGNPLVRLCK